MWRKAKYSEDQVNDLEISIRTLTRILDSLEIELNEAKDGMCTSRPFWFACYFAPQLSLSLSFPPSFSQSLASLLYTRNTPTAFEVCPFPFIVVLGSGSNSPCVIYEQTGLVIKRLFAFVFYAAKTVSFTLD